MALIKLDNFITEIRGRYGGVYFKKDRSGQHIQAMPKKYRQKKFDILTSGGQHVILPGPNAPPFVSFCGWFWAVVAAYGLAVSWAQFSETFLWIVPGANRLVKMSGYHWYMHFNITRAGSYLPLYMVPPRTPQELPEWTGKSKWFGLLTMNFYPDGTNEGRNYFICREENLCLWWYGVGWIISRGLTPGLEPYLWERPFYDVDGRYWPIIPGEEDYYISRGKYR
jgi:hypothetical protein